MTFTGVSNDSRMVIAYYERCPLVATKPEHRSCSNKYIDRLLLRIFRPGCFKVCQKPYRLFLLPPNPWLRSNFLLQRANVISFQAFRLPGQQPGHLLKVPQSKVGHLLLRQVERSQGKMGLGVIWLQL